MWMRQPLLMDSSLRRPTSSRPMITQARPTPPSMGSIKVDSSPAITLMRPASPTESGQNSMSAQRYAQHQCAHDTSQTRPPLTGHIENWGARLVIGSAGTISPRCAPLSENAALARICDRGPDRVHVEHGFLVFIEAREMREGRNRRFQLIEAAPTSASLAKVGRTPSISDDSHMERQSGSTFLPDYKNILKLRPSNFVVLSKSSNPPLLPRFNK